MTENMLFALSQLLKSRANWDLPKASWFWKETSIVCVCVPISTPNLNTLWITYTAFPTFPTSQCVGPLSDSPTCPDHPCLRVLCLCGSSSRNSPSPDPSHHSDVNSLCLEHTSAPNQTSQNSSSHQVSALTSVLPESPSWPLKSCSSLLPRAVKSLSALPWQCSLQSVAELPV